MAINRAQLVKELVPGLHALFGLEYERYAAEYEEIFDTESSERAFEEEVMLTGFGEAPVKSEGAGVSYDTAQESFTARYTHETIALAFSLTEEAIEDNLYDTLSSRYTRALARSMMQTKNIKGANILNRAFNSSYVGGDGVDWIAVLGRVLGVKPPVGGYFWLYLMGRKNCQRRWVANRRICFLDMARAKARTGTFGVFRYQQFDGFCDDSWRWIDRRAYRCFC